MESNFANRLREALELRNMSAAELSRRSEVPQHMISKYLRGMTEAKSGNLYKLAVVLDRLQALNRPCGDLLRRLNKSLFFGLVSNY